MNLILHDLYADLGGYPANTLAEDLHAGEAFDYILANPPFNFSHWCADDARSMRWQYGAPPQKNANFAWLQHIIQHLAPGGCAVTLLPNGTLTSQNQRECEIRERILLDGWVEAILALPAGLFRTTKIPCCAWVIRRAAARDTVLFVDARQMDFPSGQAAEAILELLYLYRQGKRLETTEWYAVAPMEEVAQKRYILSPNLYTLPPKRPQPSPVQLAEEFNTAADLLCRQIPAGPLCENIQRWKAESTPEDWSEVYLPELYAVFGGVSAKKDAFGRGTPMADVKTVIHNMFLPEELSVCVDLPQAKAARYCIRQGDVLLNRTSETVDELACCSVALSDRAAVYGAYLKRLRPRQEGRVDPRYMAAYFRSKIYRQEVERVSFVYTTRANINLRQLSQVRLYYPGMVQQQAMGETVSAVMQLRQEHPDTESKKAIDRFIKAFIDKFITCPVLLFQKGRDEQ